VRRYEEDLTDRGDLTDRTDLIKTVAPADPRPFWKRLLASLRLTGKVKKDGSAEVHVSGGADF
jgi:hypothetical protein